MKYLLTDINTELDFGFKNVKYFENEDKRDEYINSLFSDTTTSYKEKEYCEVVSDDTDDIESKLSIKSTLSLSELKKHNYIILEECGEYSFWFVLRVRKLKGRDGEFVFTVKKDLPTTYWSWLDNLENFEMIEGHVPVNEYLNYNFNGGDYIIENPNVLTPIKQPNGASDKTEQWLIVYRKLKDNEEGALVWNRTNWGEKNIKDIYTKVPYKIFGAPLIDRGDKGIAGSYTAKIADLFEFYNEYSNDGLTYAIKIINYEFDKYGETDFSQYDNHGYKFVEIKDIEQRKDIYRPGNLDRDNSNSYNIDIPNVSTLELLDGLNSYSLKIEGVKDFKLPLKYIYKDNDKYILSFTHQIGITPSDSKEAILFYKPNFFNTLDDSYIWTNNLELMTYVNQLNEYKANNPVTGNIGGELAQAGTNAAVGAAAGAAAGSIVPGAGTAVGAVAGASIAGVSSLVKGISGSAFKKANLKNAPQDITGGDSAYFLLSSSFSPNSFLLTENKFVGNERNSIITTLYKNGLALDGIHMYNSYNDIKRPKFNFIRITNYLESNTDNTIPVEVIGEFSELLYNGVRVWNGDSFKDYDPTWKDNGDTLEEVDRCLRTK